MSDANRAEHATVNGVVLREQTAGQLGLTEGTRNDGDAARWSPPSPDDLPEGDPS